jgi:hypothetical protein
MSTAAPRLNPRWTGLRCFTCDLAHDVGAVQRACTACGLPLGVDYDLASISFRPAALAANETARRQLEIPRLFVIVDE